MHVESSGEDQAGYAAATAKMTGSIHRFRAAAAAGTVTVDADSAERMASKLEAMAERATDRLTRVAFLEQDVRLGSSPVALKMSEQTRLSASGTPYLAKENLLLYIDALRELAAAIRASARTTAGIDSATAAQLEQAGEQL
ncbi:hypothetical protein [Actinoalloteichus spitiensis]|uniref:hypothetical protein n=1 Tax=Actinoalloteichus spitiensis TaxID=252394 RepID=UPI00036D9901|nr:hypothetical protein [Actinoalloteichus spitiensis]